LIPKEPKSKVILNAAGVKSIERGNLWIWDTEIRKVEGESSPGSLVWISDKNGAFLGMGYINPLSRIRVRVLTREKQRIDKEFLKSRIEKAKRIREEFIKDDTNAYRVVFAEADFLPGLVVDRYAEFLVVQFHTAGMEKLKEEVVGALEEIFNPKGIYERSDFSVRKTEGLEERKGVLYGKEPPDTLLIKENGIQFLVDIKEGQKTGFYIDQRENRKMVKKYAKGKKVFDLFSYTGGFSIYCLYGGASHALSVDTSEKVLEIAKENARLNGFEKKHETVKADVFEFLEEIEKGEFLILDPPGFVKRIKDLENGMKKYLRLNTSAISRIENGFLFTSSCSGAVSFNDFSEMIIRAGKRAGKKIRILERAENPPDHPVNLIHPWSLYLKSLMLHVC